jgi:hypothetical protein
MRIGLLSDTHIPEAPILFPEILDAFRGVDLLLHAGDIIVPSVLDDLETIAPVIAAQGNHDFDITDDPRVKPLQLLELEGFQVAVVHAFEPSSVGLERLQNRDLQGARLDVVVYGDSHFERIDVIDGVLCVNPGSATLPRNLSPRLGHIGFCTLLRGIAPEASIVDLSKLGPT